MYLPTCRWAKPSPCNTQILQPARFCCIGTASTQVPVSSPVLHSTLLLKLLACSCSGGTSSRCGACIRAKRGRCGTLQAAPGCTRRGKQTVAPAEPGHPLLDSLFGGQVGVASLQAAASSFTLESPALRAAAVSPLGWVRGNMGGQGMHIEGHLNSFLIAWYSCSSGCVPTLLALGRTLAEGVLLQCLVADARSPVSLAAQGAGAPLGSKRPGVLRLGSNVLFTAWQQWQKFRMDA